MYEYADEYTTRTYKDGDEIEIVRLFNKVYKPYAGFVPRTPEYWRWCCKANPEVETEGIFIISKGKEIIGYTVVGKSGNVLEFCYNSSYDQKNVILKLLRWSMKYVERRGGDRMTLEAPVYDHILREACKEMEFAEQPPIFPMFISILNLPQLIRDILSSKEKTPATLYNDTFFVRLKNTPSWVDSYVIIQIRNGEISVTKGRICRPTVTIETDVSTITSCVFGITGIYKAILSLRLKVRPIWRITKVVDLFSLLRLDDPWYAPGGDFG